MDEVQSGAVAPVVPVVETTPAPDATAAPVLEVPSGDKPPEPPPEKMLPQSEVNKILAKERAKEARRVERAIRAEVERDHYKQQLESTRQAPAAQGEPKRSDYQSDEEYADAWVDYRVEQKIAAREAKQAQESKAERQQREALERANNVREKLARGAEEFDDFEERVMGAVPFTDPMVRFIEESDIAHKVAYHLASHVEEAARIANLSPVAQIRELDKLESKLKAPPKTTNAPPPIVPNGSKTTVETGYRPDMTDKQYAEWRKRQIAQRNS